MLSRRSCSGDYNPITSNPTSDLPGSEFVRPVAFELN
jgi:hypothetical protein